MPESDKSLPENSQANLDRKLDHAVKETFPTSDPVSVTITKGGAIDYDANGNPISGEQTKGASGTGDNVLGQAKEALDSAASTASEMANGAYEQGQRYARQAAEGHPEAERLYRQGSRAVREYAPDNPVLVALLGVVVGYGVAWMIHYGRWREEDANREYAYTRRDYPFAK